MDKFTESSLNEILTSWSEHAENLRAREVALKTEGKEIESTCLGMVADQCEHNMKQLRDTMTTLRRHTNHLANAERIMRGL
jgi:hypothetical protein